MPQCSEDMITLGAGGIFAGGGGPELHVVLTGYGHVHCIRASFAALVLTSGDFECILEHCYYVCDVCSFRSY